MTEITHNLFIGDDSDCVSGIFTHIVHACKTCHQSALGYSGSLQNTHSNYLIYEHGTDLFLNMVDMERELLPRYTNPIMFTAMRFIEDHIQENKILVHCNQGFSRSPSIALLYCARKKVIPSASYQKAVSKFIEVYPMYSPGRGIALYLEHNFSNLVGNLNDAK